MDIKNLRVSLFQNNTAYQSRAIDIYEVVRQIKHDSWVKQLTEEYHRLEHNVSPQVAKREIKEQKMPSF